MDLSALWRLSGIAPLPTSPLDGYSLRHGKWLRQQHPGCTICKRHCLSLYNQTSSSQDKSLVSPRQLSACCIGTCSRMKAISTCPCLETYTSYTGCQKQQEYRQEEHRRYDAFTYDHEWGDIQRLWRKSVGVEPTRQCVAPPTGFEARPTHQDGCFSIGMHTSTHQKFSPATLDRNTQLSGQAGQAIKNWLHQGRANQCCR